MGPPGVNQPAFFRTAGDGSSSRARARAVAASLSVCVHRPTSSAAMARTRATRPCLGQAAPGRQRVAEVGWTSRAPESRAYPSLSCRSPLLLPVSVGSGVRDNVFKRRGMGNPLHPVVRQQRQRSGAHCAGRRHRRQLSLSELVAEHAADGLVSKPLIDRVGGDVVHVGVEYATQALLEDTGG
jgi:hypothetical protein